MLMLAVLPASAAASTTTQIIIKREPGLSPAERRDIRADADVRFVESLSLPRTEVVAAAPGDVRDALRDLNADPDVVYAERDRVVRALAPDQCRPYGTNPCLWGVARIFEDDPNAAWSLSQGAGRTVAVVDSGVDPAHPDLVGQIAAGSDFVEVDDDPQDEDGHGTHVAGTIAAARENGTGIAGVAPAATVVPFRALDETGSGLASDIIQAFDEAGGSGIRVVNASLGAEGFLQSEYDAIASHPDTLFVVAAGNGGSDGVGDDNDDPDTAVYPCAYGVPHPEEGAAALDNILCVGATDKNDVRATFSNFGSNSVQLYAPGIDIVSTSLGSLFVSDGTSTATPHVAATAALLAARNPSLGMAQLKDAILAGTQTVGPLELLDARASLDLTPADRDGDGVLDDTPDNCPTVENPGQEDADGDNIGDACEGGTTTVDRDGDQVDDLTDACPDEAWDGANGCPEPAVTAPDNDHDGVANAMDLCPNTPVAGGFGCPDADRDRIPNDGRDNCPAVSNPGQADTDGDGNGDACDGTPRGHDNDGDGRPSLDDACPNTYGTLPNGCPAPAPAPPANSDGDDRIDASDACPFEYAISNDGCPLAQVASLSAKARKRGSRRSATVKVAATRFATMRITVERKKGRRWARVARRTVVGTATTLRLSRLKRGAHRVRVSISSNAGAGTSRSKSFRVR
jgi:subtilisin family serine protease